MVKAGSKVLKINLSKFLQAAPNVLIFKHAPIWFSTHYLHVLGSLYYIVNPGERNLIEKNIMTVFKNRKEANEIVKKAFKGIFSHYSEKLLMAYRDLNVLKREISESIEYSGLEYLDTAIRKGGVLLVTGHFGAVEFLPLALHLCHYPVTMIVLFQTERLKESLMEKARERDVELIDGHGGCVAHKAINALKRGRILVTECDEVDAWNSNGNRTINAFGGRIRLDRTLDVLSRRSGAEVLGAFMIRINGGYCLTIVPVGDEQCTEEESISAMIMKKFEQFVMMFPDQWYQWKKFHKMRPEVA